MSRRSLLAGALALAACERGPAIDDVPAQIRAGEPTTLVGVRPPGGGEPLAITVDGRRIAQVGEPPGGTREVDLGGLVVIPGFVDAHVHLQFASAASVLAGGVTTVRDLGSPPSAAQALRGVSPLRVLLAGRILTPVGGYPTESWGADGTAREIAGVEDAVAAVDEQVLVGAVVIKVALEDRNDSPLFERNVLEAIIERAHASNVPVTAHVGSRRALEEALAVGVDELCHLPLYEVEPETMVRVAEAGIRLVPTLAIRRHDPRRALAAYRDAGGTVLYGSDLGNEGTSPGIMLEEVRALLDAGLTPAEVLASATATPAAVFGLDVGALVERKVADLVVLGGDPFADPAAYDDIRLVMAGGQVVA